MLKQELQHEEAENPKDFTVTLTDESGKKLKSLPKRVSEPQEYEAVNKEYLAVKKDIKPTAKLLMV